MTLALAIVAAALFAGCVVLLLAFGAAITEVERLAERCEALERLVEDRINGTPSQ